MGLWSRRGAAGATLGVVLLAVALAGGTAASAADTTPPVVARPLTAAPRPSTPTLPSTPATPATPAAPATGPSAPGSGPTTPIPERTLSPAQLAAQISSANALRAQLMTSNAQLAAAAARLERLATQANTLLQQLATARDAERVARTEANDNIRLYKQLDSQLTQDRRSIGRWAYQAYSGGGSFADMAAMIDSLAADPESATDRFAQLAYLSEQRALAFERVRNHTVRQREITTKAIEQSRIAADEARKAAAAKDSLDAVIVQQRTELEATRQLHAEQVTKVGPIAGLLLGSEDAAAQAASQALRDAARLPELLIGATGEACQADGREYANGQIPASALCPLYAAPGQSLRPLAADALNAMSRAYEKDSGQPICVTDSYRSYTEQILVKADKGIWAATPGRSEHGFGRALDLCGGIEDFGSPAHLWMLQNAPLYGWFHPDWAAAGGSLPEPWHWEFAG